MEKFLCGNKVVHLSHSVLKNFYQSILLAFFDNAMAFAKEIFDIPDDNDIWVILHSRNILLFSNRKPWVKKGTDKDFDISMGWYD